MRALTTAALATLVLSACEDQRPAPKNRQEAAVRSALDRLAGQVQLTSSLQGRAEPGVPVRFTVSLPGAELVLPLAEVAPDVDAPSLPDPTASLPETTMPPTSVTLPTASTPTAPTSITVPTSVTVPSTVDTSEEVIMPVSVSVSWKVSTRGGDARPDSFSRAEISPLVSDFLFDPFFTDELNGSTPGTSINFVEPTVTMRVEPRSLPNPFDIDAQEVTRTLSRLEVETLSIPLPRAVFMFLHRDFLGAENNETGAVFVAVPAQSPIGNGCENLTASVARVGDIARKLTALPRFASFVTGLDVLSSALAGQGKVVCRAQNEFPDLNHFTLIERDIVTNNTEVEDEISSMIYLGARSNLTISVYNDRDFGTGSGSFTLAPGRAGLIRIPNLASATPSAVPATDLVSGAPLLRVDSPPAGNRLVPPAAVVDFNEQISSLKFN